jgi:hypothetical protein
MMGISFVETRLPGLAAKLKSWEAGLPFWQNERPSLPDFVLLD